MGKRYCLLLGCQPAMIALDERNEFSEMTTVPKVWNVNEVFIQDIEYGRAPGGEDEEGKVETVCLCDSFAR